MSVDCECVLAGKIYMRTRMELLKEWSMISELFLSTASYMDKGAMTKDTTDKELSKLNRCNWLT